MMRAAFFLLFALAVSQGTASEPASGLRIESVSAEEAVVISGRAARTQLLAAIDSSSGSKDVTRSVQWSVVPPEVASIDATGLILPWADGEATITATYGDSVSVEKALHVSGFSDPPPINFHNQIVPIFTKLGCNGGGCHGKSGGQNGFALSLLGFYPDEDFEFIRKENRGRRIFPAAPSKSLLLSKATGTTPHGGGKRMDLNSHEYRLLHEWIEQGLPRGRETDPVVTSIRCIPDARVMGKESEQQIAVIATRSDGTTEDITRMALFEPNVPEMAECSETGLVLTASLAGEVAIMARYQGHVATFRATVPLGADTSRMPEPLNFVDQAVFGKLRLLGIPPSEICDDATFLRRASLDITGTLPDELEVSRFLEDVSPDKRSQLVDRLLDSPEYADHFANKWNFILRNKRTKGEDSPGTFAFHSWIRDSLYENKPYNQFVQEIITATGQPLVNPPVTWYREVDSVDKQVEDTAQLFLGVRIQCARCHHHPFERWSQDDYYSLAAFFSRIGRQPVPNAQPNTRDTQLVHLTGAATARNPRSGTDLTPAGLGSEALPVAAHDDPRVQLAEWMADENNPFFARILVNRYWKHFFDRGIVEPEDDMRETNPPSNPELLEALADHFVASGYDLKDLVRSICQSRTYQLSAIPNDYNGSDQQNFSRYYPRRLSAESLYDAFHQVTQTSEPFAGMPAGTRAIQLADNSSVPYFLKVFGQPTGDTACECERSDDANLAQSLHLLNSSEVQNKVGHENGRAHRLAVAADRSHESRLQELYRATYARSATPEELQIAQEYLQSRTDALPAAYEDIVWALINTKEFLFNH